MAKRLTDSNKWQDPWYMDLPSKYKLFWIYILDTCDHAGIWKVNFKVASFYVGEHLEPSEVKRMLSDRIRIIDDHYWQIIKFINFQYGGVKNDAVGKSVQNILKKHNIIGAIEGLSSPYEGTKDKDKDKVKDRVKVIGGDGEYFFIVDDGNPNGEIYRVNGTVGMGDFFEMHGSIVNLPNNAERFMRSRNGKKFNGFTHVWNDYNSYLEKK